MKIIETNNLIKRFDGVHAVDRLSIGIEKGQITGIVGPNGSGKTTLIDLLSGVLEIDGGEIIIDGTKKISRLLPHQVSLYGITRTFQNVRLFEQMTVLDNILVAETERNVFGSFFEGHAQCHYKTAEEVLRKVGLLENKNRLAVSLSYGQRKLLEIARVLAMKSRIYLFDEPFAGLFPEMRKIISSIIQELKRENKTVILVEHDMGLIRELCEHILVMDEGKLLAQGDPGSVLGKREVIEAYLGR
ncbi:MAG: ABC transporter ATP-binding protein [Minisyncoccales bacterium]|jgi:branched-chain amino acid transport system ATP-binding protein|nr:ABC transporter ATP-binding protein [Candidatus Izemoplasmatales bacterium]